MRRKTAFAGQFWCRNLIGFALGGIAVAIAGQSVPFPAFANPTDKLARSQYLAGNFVRAEALYTAAWKAQATDGEAAYVLGRIAAHREDWPQVVQFMSQAVKFQPEFMQGYLYYAQAFGEVVKTANIFQVVGLVAEFKAFIEKAAGLFPAEPDIQQLLVQFHISAPGIVGGNRETARRLLLGLKSLSPGMGFRVEAILADAEGQGERTALLYAKAAGFGQARTYLAWSSWLVKHQQGDKALRLLTENRNAVDRPELMRFFLGRFSAETASHAAEGLAALDEYLALDWRPDTPTKAEAWYQKARILAATDRKAEARQAARESVALIPGAKHYQEMLKSLGGD